MSALTFSWVTHCGLLFKAPVDLLLLLLQLVAKLLLGPLLLLLQETQLPQLLAPGEEEERRNRKQWRTHMTFNWVLKWWCKDSACREINSTQSGCTLRFWAMYLHNICIKLMPRVYANEGRWIPQESHLLVLGIIVSDDLWCCHANFHSIYNKFASLFQRLLLTPGVLGNKKEEFIDACAAMQVCNTVSLCGLCELPVWKQIHALLFWTESLR